MTARLFGATGGALPQHEHGMTAWLFCAAGEGLSHRGTA
jgi:hypothetical protein